MARNPKIVAEENEKIAALEAVEAGEADEIDEEESEEEPTTQVDEPEKANVFGVELTKQDFDELVKARDNLNGMVAAHTRRSQELADDRRALERERSEIQERLREVDHIREIAKAGGPEAVSAYLSGEELPDEVKLTTDLKDIRQRLDRLDERESAKSQSDAIAEVRHFVRSLVNGEKIFNGTEDFVTSEVQGILFTLPNSEVNETNWREKAKEIVSKKAEIQEKIIRDRLDEIIGKTNKGRKATVPPSSGAPAPRPKPKGEVKHHWVKGMENKEVDFGAYEMKAEKWLREVGGLP